MNRLSATLTGAVLFAVLTGALVPTGAAAETVRGVVTDLDQTPLAGVNISLLGTDVGAITGSDGAFHIVGAARGKAQLQASLLGYLTTRSESFDIDANTTVVDIMLREQPIEMDPTIISASAIGEQVRRAPNRVNIIGSAEIAQTAARNIQEVLQNVEGLYVTRGPAGDVPADHHTRHEHRISWPQHRCPDNAQRSLHQRQPRVLGQHW